MHRKTALFYKTLNGSRVGDVFMSIIHTAEIANINVFEYLVALQRHLERVTEDPGSLDAMELLDRLGSAH